LNHKTPTFNQVCRGQRSGIQEELNPAEEDQEPQISHKKPQPLNPDRSVLKPTHPEILNSKLETPNLTPKCSTPNILLKGPAYYYCGDPIINKQGPEK